MNNDEDRNGGQAGRVYGCHLGYPIRAYRCKGAMSVMFPISMAPGPHSSILEGFLHSIFSGLRRILGSWILVSPLLSMNEEWMYKCAARLQPLVGH